MKLYLVTQDSNTGYDTYGGFVVAAEDEHDAKLVHKLDDMDEHYGAWVPKVSLIKAEYLGEAKRGTKRGEILHDFNAG